MAAEGFDPARSRVSDNALAEFLASEIQEDIRSVPGIGPKTAERLAMEVEGDQPIETTHQLIGKFLTLRGRGMGQQEHCNAMWYYLKLRGVDAYRAGIVLCIAEKVNLLIPGTYYAEGE